MKDLDEIWLHKILQLILVLFINQTSSHAAVCHIRGLFGLLFAKLQMVLFLHSCQS